MSLILSSFMGFGPAAFQAEHLEPRHPMDVGPVDAPIYSGNDGYKGSSL